MILLTRSLEQTAQGRHQNPHGECVLRALRFLNDLYYVQSGYVDVPKDIKEDFAIWNVSTDSVHFVDVCGMHCTQMLSRR